MQSIDKRWLNSAIAFAMALSLLFCALPAAAAPIPTSQLTLEKPSLTPEQQQELEKALADFDSVSLQPTIPGDVPLSLGYFYQKEQDGDFVGLQKMFDQFAWKEFVGINWPLDGNGNPLANITDNGTPRWATWHEALQVFRPDGGVPQTETPNLCPQGSGSSRELYLTSSVFANTVDSGFADEVNQAFTTPLYDQNGNEVRYEIFLNDREYDYIVQNKLYNLDGQIEYSQTNHGPVKFPKGNLHGTNGAIEIKLAWKELDPRDIESRFYTETVLLPELDAKGEPVMGDNGQFNSCTEKTMGLVGMHVSQKTLNSPQWMWATFEHVDNLNVDDSQKVDGKNLYALFHDYSAAGQTLPVNVPPIARNDQGKPDPNGVKKTQVSRPIPIPGLAQSVNRDYQQALAAVGSPLQYYELIDSQWPTAPYPFPVFPNYGAVGGSPLPSNLPEGITRKSTGAPAPVYLTNSIMETYFQAGNQPAHFQENGFPFDNTQVFGTESCMGCHFSAGIATGYEMTKTNGTQPVKVPIFGGDLTADFSWLPQLKAQWKSQGQQGQQVVKRALAR